MSKKSKLKQYRQAQAARSGNRLDALTTYLAVLTLSVAPLVFRMVRLDFVSPVITNTTTADTGTMTDTFTHVKMWMIYLLVGALLLIFCYKLFASAASSPASAAVPVYAFELTAYDALLAALCALLLLSFFFSDYKAVALNGFVYMLDGTLEHVCYCFLFFFGFHIFSKSPRRTLFLVPLYIVGIVNALISLLNFLGVRMIDTAIIKAVLGIPVNARATDAAAFTSTFGNINYLSGFGGVLFAIFFARLLFPATSAAPRRFVSSASPAPVPVPAPVPPHRSASSSSSASPVPSVPSAPSASSLPPSALANARLSTLIESGVSLLMVAVAFSIIVTSLSSSGFLTFVVMTPVTLIFAALSGVTRRKAILAGAALVVCALIFVPLAARNPAVYEETFGIFGALTQRSVEGENPEGLLDAPPVSDMLSEREAGAETEGAGEATSSMSLAALVLPVGLNDSAAAPAVGTADPAASAESVGGAAPAIDISLFSLPSEYPAPAIAPGSGRAYIWRATLDLIARRPLVGYGMDTLTYAFPQNEINKIAGLGSYSVYVTKPHNVFVGYAYGAGVPAMLVFFGLCCLGAVSFIKYFFGSRQSGLALDPQANSAASGTPVMRRGAFAPDPLIVCLMLGWAAYMVQALVNDDLIATAPLWWTLFGIAAGMMRGAVYAHTKQGEQIRK